METVVINKAYANLRSALDSVRDEKAIEPSVFLTIASDTEKDVQLRDYLLGAPNDYGMDVCVRFICQLISADGMSKEIATPFLTVLSAYFYEMGDKEMAWATITEVLIFAPNYNLARQFKELFEKNRPTDFFQKLRNELHSKVVSGLEG